MDQTASRPDIVSLHARIAAGELTKQQAAALYGMTFANFCTKLKKMGLLESVRTPRGAAKHDSPAMEAALAEALADPDNVTRHGAKQAIARKHGLTQAEYAAFALRVLRQLRSRQKRTLSHDQTLDPAAAAGS